MDKPTCKIDGCRKPRKARELCSTHYNQTLPNRHKKVTVPCDGCGATCVKEKRAKRYENAYCSELCRDFTRHGALSCELPAKHWARMYGATCEWKHEPKPQAKRAFTVGNCADCGSVIVEVNYGTPSTYCSMTCARRVARRVRRARENSAQGTFTTSEVMRQYLRQGKVCAYCEQPVVGALPEPDHVVPLSRGGRNDMSNIVACCHQCNADKNDQTPEEWEAERAAKGKPKRRTRIYGLTGYMHLAHHDPEGTSFRARYTKAA